MQSTSTGSHKSLFLRISGVALFLFMLFAISSPKAFAATYYWVGTAGGNTNAKANWNTSAAACSGAGNASASPIAGDTINFVSNCTNGATINAALSVATISITSGYSGTITQGSGNSITISAGYSQAGGIFSGGNSAITDSGTFSLTGGTFTSTSGTLQVNSTFTISGATFTHNNGTLDLVDTNVSPTITTGGTTFYNLTLQSSDSTGNFTTSFADSFTVSNTLSVAFLNNSGNKNYNHAWNGSSAISITIPGSFSMSIPSGGGVTGVTMGSNITFNMTGASQAFSVAANTNSPTNVFNSNINFNGSGTTNVALSVNTITAGTATINQASGSVVLNGNASFYNLTINSGEVLDEGSGSNNLTVSNIFTNNAGSSGLVAETGTVTIINTTVSTTVTTGGVTFYNLTLVSGDLTGAATYSTSFADSFTVSNTLTLTSNSLGTGYNSIHTWKAASAITITLNGNLSMPTNSASYMTQQKLDSTITVNMTGSSESATVGATGPIMNASLNFNGTGTVAFTDNANTTAGTVTANQSVTLTGTGSFYSLVINSGNFTQSAGVSMTIASSYSETGGNFLGGNSTITDSGPFTLSNGTFTGTSATTTVKGNFSNTAGTLAFVANSGAFNFDSLSTNISILTGGITFYNLEIQSSSFSVGSGVTRGATIGDGFSVANNMYFNEVDAGSGGIYSASSSVPVSITVGGSMFITCPNDGYGYSNRALYGKNMTFTMTGTGSIFKSVGGTFNGPLTMSGNGETFSLTNSTFNGSTLTMSGSNQTLSTGASSLIFTVGNLNLNGSGTTNLGFNKGTGTGPATTTINQSSGSVQLTAVASFGSLIINAGNILNTESYNVTVSNYFTNNAGSSGYVAGTGTVTLDQSGLSNTITTGGATFYNLTLLANDGTDGFTGNYTSTFADSFSVTGTLSMTGSGVRNGTNAHTWTASAPITITDSGSFTFTVTGTPGIVVFGGSNITLNMTGVTGSTFGVTNGVIPGGGSGAVYTALTTISGSVALSATSLIDNTLTVLSGGTFDASPNGGTTVYNLTVFGASGFKVNSGGTFTPRTGTVTLDQSGLSNTITTGGTTFYNLILAANDENDGFSGNYTTNLADSFSVTGALTINGTGVRSGSNAHNWTAASPIVITDSGNLSFVTTSGYGSIYFGSSNITVNMTGTNKTFSSVLGGGNGGYNALTTISGTILLSANSTLAGSLTIASGGTLDMSSDGGTTIYNLTMTGNLTSSGTFLGRSSTISITGNLVLSAGTFTSTSGTLTVSGNIDSSGGGTFIHNSGTVNLGTGSQSLLGNITFYNLTKSVTAAKTLTFESAFTYIVKNTATLNGVSGGLLTLAQSGVADWYFDPQGTRTFSYLKPQHSNNIDAVPINAFGASFTDGGNNTNWIFTNAADLYWVGSAGGSVGSNSNWSTASNGMGGNGSLTSSSVLVFDGGTGGAKNTSAVFNSAAGSYAGIIILSGYTATLTQGAGNSLTIGSIGYSQTGAATFLGNASTFTDNGPFGVTAGTFDAATTTSITGSFAQSGTFNDPSGTLTVGGNFSQTGGTFNAPPTLTVGGNFTNGAGTSFSNTSLILNGTTQTISTTGTTTVNNLTRTTAGTLYFPTGSGIQVSNNIDLEGVNSGSLLSLFSVASGTQWHILPSVSGTRTLKNLDVCDSDNISATAMSASDGASKDCQERATGSDNNTNWTFTVPTLIIGATSTQLATTSIATTPGATTMLGGAFTAIAGSGNITSIKLTQNGSLAASYFSNVTIYYEQTNSCQSQVNNVVPTGAGVHTFGFSTSFSGNTITIGGTMPVSASNTCIYVQYTLIGTPSSSLAGQSIDFRIADPATDVTMTGVTAYPSTQVDIPGITTVQVAGTGITALLSVEESNPATNPTIFYVSNGSLFMSQGPAASATITQLTPPGITVTNATFTNITPPNAASGVGSVSIGFTLQKTDPSNGTVIYSKAFHLTASIK